MLYPQSDLTYVILILSCFIGAPKGKHVTIIKAPVLLSTRNQTYRAGIL